MKIIKREIVIEAPVEKVWEHITVPEKIAGWLMRTNFAPVVGKDFSLNCEHQGTIPCTVKEIVPHQKLAYSFKLESPPIETLVTITLLKEGKNTRLALVHSGWDALPPSEQGAADQYSSGWGGFLEKLKSQLQ